MCARSEAREGSGTPQKRKYMLTLRDRALADRIAEMMWFERLTIFFSNENIPKAHGNWYHIRFLLPGVRSVSFLDVGICCSWKRLMRCDVY